MLAFIMAHQTALAALGVAIIDFAFAIAPSIEANSIIQFVLSFLKSKTTT